MVVLVLPLPLALPLLPPRWPLWLSDRPPSLLSKAYFIALQ